MSFLLNVPANARRGEPPILCRHHCMYTQEKPCKEVYPNDEDHWCGFCKETNVIPAVESPSTDVLQKLEEWAESYKRSCELLAAPGNEHLDAVASFIEDELLPKIEELKR